GGSHAWRTPLGMETASNRQASAPESFGVAQSPESRTPSMTPRLLIPTLLLILVSTGGLAQETVYQPKLAVPESIQPFLKHLEPGSDPFPLEGPAKGLEARLGELSSALRAGTAQTASVTKGLLDPRFRGARLLPVAGASTSQAPLEIDRAKDLPGNLTLDARSFGAELQRLVGDLRKVMVAELLITNIENEGPADPVSAVRTTVRYD